MRYSSTSGGAGTIAENVRAGSVPMATATSILPLGRSPSMSTEPPEERAMMSTAADKSPPLSQGTRQGWGTLWIIGNCAPAGLRGSVPRRLSAAASAYPWCARHKPAVRYIPTLRLPVFGSRVTTHGKVMKRPPSFGQHCRMGKSRSEKLSRLMTSLHGPVETVLGKKLPHLREHGKHFYFV